MARKTTIAAFERWIADEANVERVLDELAGGKTLQRTAVALKQPYTCLHGYFHSTAERHERYEAACKSYADFVMEEAREIADGCKPDRDHVAQAKLRIETRQVQAKAYYRDRWGDKVQVDRRDEAPADEKLLGFASELLKLVKQREPRVIEPGQAQDVSGSVEADPPSAALPAPAAQ